MFTRGNYLSSVSLKVLHIFSTAQQITDERTILKMAETTNVVFSISSMWNFVLTIIASIGGGAIIVTAAVKFTSEKIADRLNAKYQLKLEMEMERYKADIEKTMEAYRAKLGTGQHISVKRFDAEFEIYQKITKAFFDAIRDCSIMIPAGYSYSPVERKDKLKEDADHFNVALKSVASAQDYLYSVAPFIQEQFFMGYKEILKLMNTQLNTYLSRYNKTDLRPQKEKEDFGIEDFNRTSKIDEQFNKLNGEVRKYLNSLDVIG